VGRGLRHLLKTDASDHMANALRALAKHKPYLCPEVAEQVLEGYLKTSAVRDAGTLSERENQIPRLLAEGESNQQVAHALGVSIRTAETHRIRIMHKLQAHSASDLVR
jgi:two-component system, NarL family, response regulator NreC